MSNRQRLRAAPGRLSGTRLAHVPDPRDIHPDSPHDRVLRSPALRRRPPTVQELVWLADRYDVVTSPTPIVVIETEAGLRFEGLHWRGWPAACDCGSPPCNGEVDR